MTDGNDAGVPQHLQVARHQGVLQVELYGPHEGPMVVFTHGGWMDRRMFAAQVQPVVAAGYQVLLWDLVGHGESAPRGVERPSVADMGTDLLAVLDAVGYPEPVFLVGQSLGGMISQQVALAHADRVAGLVTIGSPCINPDNRRLARRMSAVWRISAFLTGLVPISLLLDQLPQGTARRPEVQDYVRTVTRNVTKESFRWLTSTALEAGEGLRGRVVQVPVLITRGEQDTSGAGRLTLMTAQHWVERDPDAHFAEIPGAGHQAHQDQPEIFNDLLLDFLDARHQASR